MNIRNFLHKGLLRLYVEDSPRGVPPDAVAKLRTMLTFLQDMRSPEELRAFPLWKAHALTGDRKGHWRLTFRFQDGEIADVNFEDYH